VETASTLEHVLMPKFRPDELPAKVQKIVSTPSEVAPGSSGDDYLRRRGVPVLSVGVAGVMANTRPDRAVLQLDKR
jgi:hypothetical protein